MRERPMSLRYTSISHPLPTLGWGEGVSHEGGSYIFRTFAKETSDKHSSIYSPSLEELLHGTDLHHTL